MSSHEKWNVEVLREFKPGRRYNILLFGCSGSGKSSLINNLNSQNRKRVTNLAKIRRRKQIDQCTVSYKAYKFNENVWVYDTWGYCKDSNYSRNEFGDMLDGKVQEGTTFESYAPSERNERRIIDVVIFVLGNQDLGKEEIAMLKPFFEEAVKKKKKCLAVATMTDLWFKNEKDIVLLRMKPPKVAREYIVSEEDWMEKVSYAITEGIMGENDGDGDEESQLEVLPVINYKHVDKITLDVVEFLAKQLVLAITSDENETPLQPPDNYEIDLFEGEGTEKLRYLKTKGEGGGRSVEEVGGNMDQLMKDQMYTVEMEEEEDELSSDQFFVASRLYFKCLLLGTKKFRFFLTTMLHAPKQQILGLFHSQGKEVVYFETASTDPKLEESLQRSFSDEFIGGYEFISEGRGAVTSTFELTSTTTHVYFFLCGGKVRLLFKKRQFGPYSALAENNIQLVKKNTLMKEKVDSTLLELAEVKDTLGKWSEKFESDSRMEIEASKVAMEKKFSSLLNQALGEIRNTMLDFCKKSDLDDKLNTTQVQTEIETKLQDFYKKSDVDVKLDTKLDDTQVQSKIDTELGAYYKKSDVDTKVTNLKNLTCDHTWININTFANGWHWSGDDPNWTKPAYYKDAKGMVHLKGAISKGNTNSSVVMFTLPNGYRPVRNSHIDCPAHTTDDAWASVLIRIDRDGNVRHYHRNKGHGTVKDWLSLDSITFSTKE